MSIKKTISSFIVTLLVLGVMVSMPNLLLAQDDTNIYDYEYTTTVDGTGGDEVLAGMLGGGMLIVFSIVSIVAYIYMAFAFSTVGKKVNEPNSWMAWIPFLNLYYMLKLAQLSGWLMFVYLAAVIPLFGAIIVLGLTVYIYMKIAERRGFPNWVGILVVIPFINFVVPGYLAWAEPSGTVINKMPETGAA